MKATKVDECHLTIALVVSEKGISEDMNDIVIIRSSYASPERLTEIEV